MQYHTHDERYLMIQKVKEATAARDLEIAARPTYYEVIQGFDDAISEGTTTPAIPILTYCKGAYTTISIAWDTQQLLTPVHWYEIMVSDNETNWYELRTDGVDWKGDEDVPTVVYGNLFQHSGIPLGGTAAEPTSVTLYYRVRRKTINEVSAINPSAWSSTSTATISPIGTGGIEALSIGADKIIANTITAAKIAAGTITTAEMTAGFLQALFAAITSLYVGYDGTGEYSDPDEGDLSWFFDKAEQLIKEYTDGTWSNANAIRLGGRDSTGVFISGVSCRQVVNPQADEISQEFIPDPTYYNTSFESDFTDSAGNVPTIGACTRSSTWSKFGTYSLAGNSGNAGIITYESSISAIEPLSVGIGAWVNITSLFTSDYFAYIFDVYYDDGIIYGQAIQYDFAIQRVSGVNNLLGRVAWLGTNSGSEEILIPLSTAPGEVYLWMTIDVDNGEVLFGVNSTVYTLDYGAPIFSSTLINASIIYGAATAKNGLTFYLDDGVYSYSNNAVSDVFLQHYNHNVPWNTDYSAKDLILRPADGGVLQIGNGLKITSRVNNKTLNRMSIAPVEPPRPSNLVAHYALENTAKDTTGNYNGAATDVTYSSDGYLNSCAVFNGSTSEIDTGVDDEVDNLFAAAGNRFTIFTAFKCDSLPAANSAFFGRQNVLTGFVNPSGVVRVLSRGANTSTGVTITTGKWNTCAVKWDGTTLTARLNGVNYAIAAGTNGFSGTQNVLIGAYASGNNNFDGEIDETYLYNTDLSDDEIDDLGRRYTFEADFTNVLTSHFSSVVGAESWGTPHTRLPATAWDLLGGGSATGWTDLDCSSLLEKTSAKGVYLTGAVVYTTNTTGEAYAGLFVRKNGVSGSSYESVQPVVKFTTAPSVSGKTYTIYGAIQCEVDSSQKLEYIVNHAGVSSAVGYLSIIGYYE